MSDENKVLLRVSNLKQYFPIGKKKDGKTTSSFGKRQMMESV